MIQGQVQHGDDEHPGEGHYGVDDSADFQHRPEVGPSQFHRSFPNRSLPKVMTPTVQLPSDPAR